MRFLANATFSKVPKVAKARTLFITLSKFNVIFFVKRNLRKKVTSLYGVGWSIIMKGINR